ncbi:MAG: ComEC/Rec2 family competence protein [Mycoplasmataceae bacterium]|nr:ComEC/Rec2 family competence protein [Mycoplasmataceae bacterium]
MLLILLISWKIFIISIISVVIFNFTFLSINDTRKIIDIQGNYKIVNVISSGYVVEKNNLKILLKTKNYYNLDDLLSIEKTLTESLKDKKDKYNFYLKSLGINYIVNNPTMKKMNNKTSIRSKILNYISTGPDYYVKYISLILIGKKNDSNAELYERVKIISILHLFVISGFHINLLIFILLKFFKKMKISHNYASLISFIIIGIYLYILNFPISSVRSFLFLIFIFLNNYFNKNKLSRINILTIIMLSMFLINPFIIFSLSFILSFSISFSILLISNVRWRKYKPIIISSCAYLASIILSININGWFNIFGFFNSIIFSPIIVLNYIVSILGFPFKSLLNNYYIFIDSIINIFYVNSLVVNLTINNLFIDIYYLFFWFSLIIINHYYSIRYIDVVRNKNMCISNIRK